MKPLLFSLVLFIPFALGARYYFVCQTLHWCTKQQMDTLASPHTDLIFPNASSLQLQLGTFPQGSDKLPRNPEMLKALDQLSSAVFQTEDYNLLIEGPVYEDETWSSAQTHFKDLGMARAAALASELQKRGVDGNRLELKSLVLSRSETLKPRLSFQPFVPVGMSHGLPIGEVLLDSFALMGLRFDPNSTALAPTAELDAFAEQLIDALRVHPQLKLSLIGHTDNVDEELRNDSLGMWRARAVANYFYQLGYPGQIEVISRGEREPVADNQSPEGRYQNRRVEVRIQ